MGNRRHQFNCIMYNFVSVSAVMATVSLTSGFAPSTKQAQHAGIHGTALNVASLNGWQPDESKFAFGLPGSLDPSPEFDPFGFADRADLTQMKSYREAETTHGRVKYAYYPWLHQNLISTFRYMHAAGTGANWELE